MAEIDPKVLDNLDEGARLELMKWIEQENSKAKFQSSVHDFTDMCFKKCVTKPIATGTLDRDEEPCISNCVHRFLDANISVVNMIQKASRQ
ncbi:Tim10/DDP family zinc finger-domain-containing protein [Dipodascopsis tothii]|uniref:Tim10/DDP family zinc finger-domain-containing protein n=1 Tax=Dipodascopsis tothii TaxID=44089 RepID=UPI0034CD7C40